MNQACYPCAHICLETKPLPSQSRGWKKSQFLMQKGRESRILVAHFMPVLIINAAAEPSSYRESLSTSLPASPQTIKGCPSSQWLSKKTAMRRLKPVFKKQRVSIFISGPPFTQWRRVARIRYETSFFFFKGLVNIKGYMNHRFAFIYAQI